MKCPIVILHGWGKSVSGKRFSEVKKLLEKKGYQVFTPDLPGFGSNPLTKESLNFDDYVAFVKNYVRTHKFKEIILVGHSFGGRIAIAFTALYPSFVSKLILIAPSGIPHSSLKKKTISLLTKIVKPIFLLPIIASSYNNIRKLIYYSLGEMDYYKSGNLSATFKNVYQVSILHYLKKIKVPTLLIWGENDTFVPISDGETMHQKIQNSRLIKIKNATHIFPYEQPNIFVGMILNFLD